MRRSVLGLAGAVLLLAAAGQAAADLDAEPYAPSFVAEVVGAPGTTLVSWGQGVEVADSFNVYGVPSQGGPVLLGTVLATDPYALTVSGFPTYAVSGVKLGVESKLVYPLGGQCLHVSLDPPGAGLYDCPQVVDDSRVRAALRS